MSSAKSIIHNELDLISGSKQCQHVFFFLTFSVWEVASVLILTLNNDPGGRRFPHNVINSDSVYSKATITK